MVEQIKTSTKLEDHADHEDSKMNYRSVWTYLSTVPHTLDWINVQGINTRFLQAGDPSAPTVILVHGTAGSLENFVANYGALSKKYHVIGLDLLGCGYTDKPDRPYLIKDYGRHLLDFMDALGIGTAALIGVSLGSWISAWVAKEAPNRVAGLGMMAPAGIVVDADRERKFAEGVRQRRSAAAADPTWASVTRAMRGLVLHEEDLIDDLVATRLRIYQQPSLQKVMGHLLAFVGNDQHLENHEWTQITTPALIVASVDAPNIFLDNAYRLAELLPNAQLWEVRECDHWPQFEKPTEVNKRLLEALGEWLPISRQ